MEQADVSAAYFRTNRKMTLKQQSLLTSQINRDGKMIKFKYQSRKLFGRKRAEQWGNDRDFGMRRLTPPLTGWCRAASIACQLARKLSIMV